MMGEGCLWCGAGTPGNEADTAHVSSCLVGHLESVIRQAFHAVQDIEWALKNPDMGGTHYFRARDKAEEVKRILRAALGGA